MKRLNIEGFTRQRSWTQLVLLIAVITIFCFSCKDLIEINLSDKIVVLIAPTDNITTKLATQTFWWDALDGASSYTLQVVSASFDSIEKVVVDTTITSNKFTLNLYPGRFAWRVRAINGSTMTSFFFRKLVVDSTINLEAEIVELKLPTDSFITNNREIAFGWNKLYNATNYTMEIRSPDWNGAAVFNRSATTYDTISKMTVNAGNYVWGVKASNNKTSTDFTKRVFIIDTIVPGAATLISPANKSTVTQMASDFSWSRATDMGTKLSDSVIVSTDSLFTMSKVKISILTKVTSSNITLPDTGTYYWRVKTMDAAGNQGPYPSQKFWKLTVHKN